MNENIDLTKILKDCPKGWKFYSSIYGEVEFKTIKFEQLKPIYNPNMLFGLSSLFEEDPCPIKFIAQDVERSVSKAGEHIKGIGELPVPISSILFVDLFIVTKLESKTESRENLKISVS